MSKRKLKYGNDWFDTIHSEIRVPREPRVPIEPINVNVMYPQMAPCPPGYKYRPKRKPGQRKCTKETVKSVLSFLQILATQNRISIFKLRKDKKGYTRTLLTIPKLKSRLTRHGISYKMNKFGMQSLDATSRAMRRSALRSGNAPYTNVYSEISDLTSRNPGRTSEAARGSAILVSAVRAAQIAEMRAAAARMREMVEARRAAARARYISQQLTGRGGSRDFEDTTSTGFGRRMRFGMEGAGYPPELTLDELEQVRSDARARGQDEIEAVRTARRARATARWEARAAIAATDVAREARLRPRPSETLDRAYRTATRLPSYIPSPAEMERVRAAARLRPAGRWERQIAAWAMGSEAAIAEAEAATREGRLLTPRERGFVYQNTYMLEPGRGGSGDIEDTAPTGEPESDDDYDPFTVFEFGKRRPKDRPRTAPL